MEPTILLILTLAMRGQQPDIKLQIAEPSIEQCWKDAREFVARGTPNNVENAVGVMAACLTPRVPEHDS